VSTGRQQLNAALMKMGLTRTQAARALRALLGGIYERLAAREHVAIHGFGAFYFRQNHRALMWDPRSGTRREVKGRTLLRFRPSQELLELLRKRAP